LSRGPGTQLDTASRKAAFWEFYTRANGEPEHDEWVRWSEEIGEPSIDLPAPGGPWFLRVSFDLSDYAFRLTLAKTSEDLGSADVDPEWHDFAEDEDEIAEDEPVHPHVLALRWEELTAVVDRMRAAPDLQQVSAGLAMLLLARFVGQDEDEKDPARRAELAAELAALGAFTGAGADRMAAELLPDPRAGHRWHHDSVRGWRLDTGRWCHSWRDGDHDFPFEEMAAFRSMLGLPA
jgi:hypothetical protein